MVFDNESCKENAELSEYYSLHKFCFADQMKDALIDAFRKPYTKEQKDHDLAIFNHVLSDGEC